MRLVVCGRESHEHVPQNCGELKRRNHHSHHHHHFHNPSVVAKYMNLEELVVSRLEKKPYLFLHYARLHAFLPHAVEMRLGVREFHVRVPQAGEKLPHHSCQCHNQSQQESRHWDVSCFSAVGCEAFLVVIDYLVVSTNAAIYCQGATTALLKPLPVCLAFVPFSSARSDEDTLWPWVSCPCPSNTWETITPQFSLT